MLSQPTTGKKRQFAVAVRDGNDLLLILTICRGPQGDVYVNFPRDQIPAWKPHSSYHASGQHHQKSFGQKLLVAQRQKPTATFSHNENVVTTPLAADEPRTLNLPCDLSKYDGALEIPLSEVRPERYRTHISVDLADANKVPIITPGANVLCQAVFDDALPNIVVTFFDTGPW